MVSRDDHDDCSGALGFDDEDGYEDGYEDDRAIPGRLCAAAVRLLPVTGASVSLRVDGMPVRLSAHAFAHGRTADDVARDVVTHRTRFDRT